MTGNGEFRRGRWIPAPVPPAPPQIDIAKLLAHLEAKCLRPSGPGISPGAGIEACVYGILVCKIMQGEFAPAPPGGAQ